MTRIITVSAVIAAVVLAAIASIFMFNKSATQSTNIELSNNSAQVNLSPSPTVANSEPPPAPEVKVLNISALSIATVYKDIYEEKSKCRKTYNEYFGNEDGMISADSPCHLNMEFERDSGYASRSIAIRQWDKSAKQDRLVERLIWKGNISPEQFDQLAKAITENIAFKNWKEGVTVTTSNCEISVTTPSGVRKMMANVDKSATAYLSMVKAFQEANEKIHWERAQ